MERMTLDFDFWSLRRIMFFAPSWSGIAPSFLSRWSEAL
jgi:hypothetical protein